MLPIQVIPTDQFWCASPFPILLLPINAQKLTCAIQEVSEAQRLCVRVRTVVRKNELFSFKVPDTVRMVQSAKPSYVSCRQSAQVCFS